MAELVHAIAIMVHYHCLAAFVYGCGINPEVDLDGGHTFVTPTVSDSSSNAEPTTPTSTVVNAFNDVHREQNSTQTLLERMKKVEKDHEQEEETSQEEVLRQFHSIQNKERRFCFYFISNTGNRREFVYFPLLTSWVMCFCSYALHNRFLMVIYLFLLFLPIKNPKFVHDGRWELYRLGLIFSSAFS